MKFIAICKPPNLGNTESLYLGTDHFKSISLKYRAWSTVITVFLTKLLICAYIAERLYLEYQNCVQGLESMAYTQQLLNQDHTCLKPG
jgi:hypothetical protein